MLYSENNSGGRLSITPISRSFNDGSTADVSECGPTSDGFKIVAGGPAGSRQYWPDTKQHEMCVCLIKNQVVTLRLNSKVTVKQQT